MRRPIITRQARQPSGLAGEIVARIMAFETTEANRIAPIFWTGSRAIRFSKLASGMAHTRERGGVDRRRCDTSILLYVLGFMSAYITGVAIAKQSRKAA